ncbi:DUF4335 domain-containing protein [Phormidium pseudopriestleyi FRX01]|uniref:DUF4335 domain-containing protein n=1 Tax=Phormidium pseudopriestleyi FRX01 TaxID=1759528 RepID=A0ABS3FUE8_9CYAN|nr:DUF4335 domain-containing protein [Phormidium pseudopriestleyi FRX01]
MAKSSPLSKWMGKPVLKQLRFQLSFDAPQLPQEQQVTIRGDARALDALSDAVTNYVQDFVQQSPQRLNATYFASEADATSTPSEVQTEITEPTTRLQSPHPTLEEKPIAGFPSPPPDQASWNSQTLVPLLGIYLKPRGLLAHELHFGELATSESGPLVNLGTLQLFDLATALDSAAADLLALPNLGGVAGLSKTPPWLAIAAMALFTVGVSASLFKLLNPATEVDTPTVAQSPAEPFPEQNVTPVPPPIVSPQTVPPGANPAPNGVQTPPTGQQPSALPPTAPTSPPVPPVAPPVGETTPPLGPQAAPTSPPPEAPPVASTTRPIPEARQSPLQVPQTASGPQRPQVELEITPDDSDPIPPMRPMPSLADDPIPEPPDWDALMGQMGNSTSAPEPSFTPRPTTPERVTTPAPMQPDSLPQTGPERNPAPAPAPAAPNLGALDDAPPPLPNVRLDSSARVPEVADESLVSEAEGMDAIALKAPPTELPESEWSAGDVAPETAARTQSIFEDPPQLAEAKNYFQESWQPPQGFKDKLEYVLTLNPDGSIQQIVPLGIASGTHIDISGVPLQGTPFVSPLPEAQSLQIRVVLEPDGRVLTFAQ